MTEENIAVGVSQTGFILYSAMVALIIIQMFGERESKFGPVLCCADNQ